MGFGGVYCSKTRIIILVVGVCVLLLFVGLMAGLVNRPSCDTTTVDATESPMTTAVMPEKTTAASEATGPWSNVRLRDNLIPVEYTVDLRPVFDKAAEGRYLFYGSSSVTYTCVKATEYIIMHSRKLNYTKDDVRITQEGNDVAIKDLMFYEPNHFVVVEIEQPCTVGLNYVFSVDNFVSELSDDLQGIYRSEYDKEDGTHKVIATSQMQVDGARETFPCFDEPALKANFTVTLWFRADTGDFALSNMPPASHQTKMIGGVLWNSTTFEETVPMSTYLLALVVCDFSYLDAQTSDGIQTRIYARTEAIDNGEAVYPAQLTPKLLEYFENYFNVPYALPKCDQIAVPDFSFGAMENWGLTVYRETFLLYNDELTSISEKKRISEVISHEVAHMWFGNLVSPAWWDDIWLNEGFATYCSIIGMNQAFPEGKEFIQFLPDFMHRVMETDALASAHPLVQQVRTTAEALQQFNLISYYKGAAVLRMINGFMGEGNFTSGLTTYMNNLAYSCATHRDLFEHWAEQAKISGPTFPVDLPTILETWTLQMGFPVINVVKKDSTTFSITQEHFLLDSNAIPEQTNGSLTYGYKWYVPFTYKTKNQIGTDEFSTEWLLPDQELTIAESDFLLGNIHVNGYYRVNYDANTWIKLVEILNSGSFEDIPEANRVQLIDDAFNLPIPGRLSIEVGMDLSKYLSREPEYAPWKTFLARAKSIEYFIGRSPIYGTFSNYILQLVEPNIYNKYGFIEDDKTDAAILDRSRVRLGIQASCYYGSEDCITNATKLYKLWMENPDDWSIISTTYRRDVYCTAIKHGGVEEWNFAWDRHGNTSNGQRQDSLRWGMSCSNEPWILRRYMSYCLDSTKVRLQDSIRTCLGYIATHDYGRDMLWNYISGNWNDLATKYALYIQQLVDILSRRFSTEYDLHLLENLKASSANVGTTLDQAIDRAKGNIKWRKENEEKLTEWLNANTLKKV